MNVKRLTYGVLLLSIIGLTACHEDSCYDDCYDDSTSAPHRPQLYMANMVDTYAVNSEFDNEHLALSPYVNFGEFEVFWDMRSEGDFFVELRVNDIDQSTGSRLITSDWCSPYSDCYHQQYQYCDYSSDFYLTCDTPSDTVQEEYIGDLVKTLPQDLYFIVQVCDTSFIYCEYQSFPVLME
ncbi:hypothetical protein TDB9533_02095 [Thalassocella blandensis]|nr:hypothetical protein TDB9533_02095 [Thalassocella blandensis]